MRYTIRHTTRYSYDQPVYLQPSVIRLRPCANGTQLLHQFQMRVNPTPAGESQLVDLEGNSTTCIWFPANVPLDYLAIVTSSDVEILRDNPFDFVYDSAFTGRFPVAYSPALQAALFPALHREGLSNQITELALGWIDEAKADVLAFLMLVCKRLSVDVNQTIRQEGAPQVPEVTWASKRGACRDLAVLFMAICRSVGLAARFVSGYAQGFFQQGRTELHAWAEVYLPGGGWRGYDPTMGIAVSNRHIALAVAADPELAAPFEGTFLGPPVLPHLMYDISITRQTSSQQQQQ